MKAKFFKILDQEEKKEIDRKKRTSPNTRQRKETKQISTMKASFVLLGLVACVALTHAAGIKGGPRADDSQQRIQGLKGPRPQPQQPYPQAALPTPQAQAQAPRPQPTKGAGQVTPVFSAARVQPIQQQVQIQQQEQEPEQQQVQQQVQQQESEIDPSAAAQDSAPSVAAPAQPAPASSEEEQNPRPEPYAFNYAFESGDSATSGSSRREEQQDASGKVTGFYTLRGEDGRDRRVDYIADANGFRATISTNEMGTAPKDSADVDWNAQSPTDAQLRAAESATQLARQRALLNPQPSASGSSSAASSAQPSKISSPRQQLANKGQQQISSAPAISQLQEPFEQIRQVELNNRARKSRHAPFYLFTV